MYAWPGIQLLLSYVSLSVHACARWVLMSGGYPPHTSCRLKNFFRCSRLSGLVIAVIIVMDGKYLLRKLWACLKRTNISPTHPAPPLLSCFLSSAFSFPCQISFFLLGFSISAMFCAGAYLVLHATFLYSTKPPVGVVEAEKGGAAATSTASAGAKSSALNDVETAMIQEKELLLQSSESSASPRTGRGTGAKSLA